MTPALFLGPAFADPRLLHFQNDYSYEQKPIGKVPHKVEVKMILHNKHPFQHKHFATLGKNSAFLFFSGV